MKRGTTLKRWEGNKLILERKMVTHHDVMVWDMDKCVGCQLGPHICKFEAETHTAGTVVDGRMATKLIVDVDPETCVFCGMCTAMCPVHAISQTLNGEDYNPVLAFEAFPPFADSNQFDRKAFNWDLKDFVLENCPTEAISYHEAAHTLVIDQEACIRCRQCEVASDGAFHVEQRWEGTVTLRREKCIEGCLACADICPTRALHVNDEGELVLADYYCIHCGACVQICPVDPVIEDVTVTLTSQGVTYERSYPKVMNASEMPIWVERWRARHAPVESGAWVAAIERLADPKAAQVEIENKRAEKRRELIVALEGDKEQREREAARREALIRALGG